MVFDRLAEIEPDLHDDRRQGLHAAPRQELDVGARLAVDRVLASTRARAGTMESPSPPRDVRYSFKVFTDPEGRRRRSRHSSRTSIPSRSAIR